MKLIVGLELQKRDAYELRTHSVAKRGSFKLCAVHAGLGNTR